MTAPATKKRDPDDHLIGAIEVARILNVHPITIHRHCLKQPEFPRPIRVGGNRLSWWHSDIVEYINARAAVTQYPLPSKRKRRASAETADAR
jgi:predicted DNA-binding transcriptional regulator AlpA